MPRIESRVGTPNLTVVKAIDDSDKNLSRANYRIDIRNEGGTRLASIKLVDIMPIGLRYLGSKLRFMDGTEMELRPENTTSQNLTWDLPGLDTSESVYLILSTEIVGDADDKNKNEAYATYIFEKETRRSQNARIKKPLTERE